MDGYWMPDMSEHRRKMALADWCDEMEEWPVDSVKAALRKWRRDNPNKKPNPGHIHKLLSRAWGERNAKVVAELIEEKPQEPKQRVSEEARKAILAEIGVKDPLSVQKINQE